MGDTQAKAPEAVPAEGPDLEAASAVDFEEAKEKPAGGRGVAEIEEAKEKPAGGEGVAEIEEAKEKPAGGEGVAEIEEDCTGDEPLTLEELQEWAEEEKLPPRFRAGIPEIYEQGGLRKVTDDTLKALGIIIAPMRTKIIIAIKQKLKGGKKLRFGKVERYEPTLKKRPTFNRGVWVEVRESEDRAGWRAARPALTTWRFMTQGTDGLDDFCLLQETFGAWKDAVPKDWFTICREWLFGKDGVSGFIAKTPCCGPRPAK